MATRTYEVMYIAQPDTTEDDVTKLNDSVQKLVESEGGNVVKLDNMGRRKLAYEIKRETEGHYVLFEIEGSGKEIAEIERRFRVNDAVMRYITVRVDEDRKAAEKNRAKRERRAERRALNGNSRREEEENMMPAVEEAQDNE